MMVFPKGLLGPFRLLDLANRLAKVYPGNGPCHLKCSKTLRKAAAAMLSANATTRSLTHPSLFLAAVRQSQVGTEDRSKDQWK